MDQTSIVFLLLILPLMIFMIVSPRMTLSNLKCGVVKNVKSGRFFFKAVIYLLLGIYIATRVERDAKSLIICSCLFFLTIWYIYHGVIIKGLNDQHQREEDSGNSR